MDSIFSARKFLPALLIAVLSSVALSSLAPIGVAQAALRGVIAQPLPPSTGSANDPANDSGVDNERLYIVQFTDLPAMALPGVTGRHVRTSGLLAGITETRRFDPDSSEVRSHVRKLDRHQRAILQSLGLSDKQVYAYRYTFNGLALKLTAAQADALRLHKQVSKVWEDRRRRVSTSDSPAFLGLLNDDNGLRTDLGLKGDGVIIGVIDSGITPGHPSMAGRQAEKEKPRLCRSEWAQNSLLGLWLCRRFSGQGPELFGDLPDRWRGACETGENFRQEDCNRKLIGARFYNAGFVLDDQFALDEYEFISPADADGHGTHIASIAAGNEVEADIFGRSAGRISGIAPRARIAVYKACWLEPGAFRATCSVADLQAAIEDAVADGVDIINYSVGSLDDSLTDPDDLALLAAAEAGVLSVVATGNGGPEPFTMMAPATTPWVLSVGASSRSGNRVAEGLRINKPESLAGDYESREASFTPTLLSTGPVTARLVLADDGNVMTPEGDIGTVIDACSELLNADELSNRIAFIQRGGCDFLEKVRFAQNAGAKAVVVFSNDQPLQVMAGNVTGIDIPAVMMGQADGQLLRDKLFEGDEIEITLDKSIFINFAEAGNIMGSFSGRGPSLADPDFLKPDIVAPGVRILGGQSPDVANGFRGEDFQYLSGTSQSAPHVAGLAALIKQQHPDWSPAEIKSSLMTTARQNLLKESAGAAADPFDMGAGHVVPNLAIDPGLLYDTRIEEYDAYLCSIGLARINEQACEALAANGLILDARDVNLPSIAVTELVSETTVTRTVRNVGPAATFRVEIDAPAGLEVAVTPTTLSLAENETADFSIEFRSNGAALYEWLFGSYSWVSDHHQVRSPFAVQPAQIAFTEQSDGNGANSSSNLEVSFGYDGGYSAIPLGLELPCVLPDNNLTDSICTNTSPATVGRDINPFSGYQYKDVPDFWVTRFFLDIGNDQDRLLRISLFDELTDGNDDLDLYLYYCIDENADTFCEDIEFLGSSQRDGSSDEELDVLGPPPGVYIIDVHGYDTENAAAKFCLYSWALGSNDVAGNLSLANVPGAASAGTNAIIGASWAGLDDGLWLGGVSHQQDQFTALGLTVIDVDVNGLPVQNSASFSCP
jgi:subtilisin family serine protease